MVQLLVEKRDEKKSTPHFSCDVDFSKRLKLFCEKNEISPSDLAFVLSVSRQAVYKVFSGKSFFSVKHLSVLAHRFPGLDLNWLITGKNAKESNVEFTNDV